jgi:APA family basic amino acid/polyamine antiporter
MFRQIDESTNMVPNSAVYGLLMCCVWMVYFYGANLTAGWFGPFCFDSSELPNITIYAMYIPMFIMWMVKEKELGTVKRFVLPALSTVACAFMVFAAVYAHGITPFKAAAENGKFSFPVLFYIIIFAVIMLAGFFCSSSFKKMRGKTVEQAPTEDAE